MFVINLFETIGFSALRQMRHHYRILMQYTDPMVVVSKRGVTTIDTKTIDDDDSLALSKTKRAHFSFVCAFVTLSLVYGFMVLPLLSGDPIQNGPRTLATHPLVASHQIMPRNIWAQMDLALLIDIIATLALLTALALVPVIKPDHMLRLYHPKSPKSDGRERDIDTRSPVVTIGGKPLERTECREMARVRRRFVLGRTRLLPFFYGWTAVFCYVQVVGHIIGNDHHGDLASALHPLALLFWSLLFPWLLVYVFYCLFGQVIYIMLASNYIQVRQRYLLSKLITSTESNSSSKSSTKTPQVHYRIFMSLNIRQTDLFGMIREYGRFCQPLLTIMVPYYISVQCYVLYIVLYRANGLGQGTVRVFLSFVVGMINLCLFTIVQQCAKVVGYNLEAHAHFRRFVVRHLSAIGHQVGLRLEQRLKVESLQLYARFKSSSFRVLLYHRITSNTFYLIISYISIFFIFVTKDQLKR